MSLARFNPKPPKRMKKRRNNSNRASTLQIALSTGLISISAILLAIAAPTNRERAPRHNSQGFQLKENTDADFVTALGNYPDTSIPLSADTTVTPDATPTVLGGDIEGEAIYGRL